MNPETSDPDTREIETRRITERRLGAALVSFLVVFLSCYGSILLIRSGGALAPIWPANALIVVYLLRTPMQFQVRGDVLIAAVSGSIIANFLGGSSAAATLWFTMANGLEVFVAYWWIRWRIRQTSSAVDAGSRFRRFGALIQASLLAPAVGACASAALLSSLTGAPLAAAWFNWWSMAALGMLIVLPIGLRINADDLRRLTATRATVRCALGCVMLVAIATSFVFLQDLWPLLFLITPAIFPAAYKHRAIGAAASIFLVALIAAPLTAQGHGPLSLVQVRAPHEQQVLLQVFFLTQSLMALTIAAALDDRDNLRYAVERRESEAHQSAQAQSRLLSSVAHELRSPVNVIQGLAGLLAERPVFNEHERTMMKTMVGASEELQTLANDLLDRSRIDRGALRLRQKYFAIGPLLAEVRDEVLLQRASFSQSIVMIDVPEGPIVWADPLRTKQIMRNLLTNALKYAGSFGPVAMRAVSVDDPLRPHVRLDVIDRGPGIARVRQYGVFEAFGELGPESASKISSGVGLSVVKMLAEVQGGRAGFSSAPFIETRFWVELPARPPGGQDVALSKEGGDEAPDPRGT